jgi:TonB family protein
MTKIKAVHIAISMLIAGLVCTSFAQERKDKTTSDESIVVETVEGMRYPPLARTGRVEGHVVVKVKLDDAGRVVSADALRDEKLGMLIPDALSNARKWRFHPNRANEAEIFYQFQLLGECVHEQSMWRFVFKSPNVVLISDCAVPAQP